MLWGTLLFSAEVTLPVCLLIFLGWLLKKQQCIDDAFCLNRFLVGVSLGDARLAVHLSDEPEG